MTIPQLVAPPPAPVPVAPQPRVKAAAAAEKEEKRLLVKKLAWAGGVLAALGVFYYFFGLGLADKFQRNFNEKTDKMAKDSGGGELTHIANLYEVLDKTEPEHMAATMRGGNNNNLMLRPLEHHGHHGRGMAMDEDEFVPPPDPSEKLAVIPSEWTLNLQAATIPEGRANGAIAGTNFVIKSAALQPSGAAIALTLKQGDDAADPAFFIYLGVTPGETAPGHSWTVDPQVKAKGTPQIVKRWQPNARFAPVQKSFSSGYALQLELGQATNFWIPGKIYLSLPDKEKTFLAGQFFVPSFNSQ